MSVCCECCVLSGRGLCEELVQRSPTDCGVSDVCDHETSTKRGGPGPYRAVEPYKKKVFDERKIQVHKGLKPHKLRVNSLSYASLSA
jgi:hypothetical protein